MKMFALLCLTIGVSGYLIGRTVYKALCCVFG